MYLSRLGYFFCAIEAISQKLETQVVFRFFRHRKKPRNFCPKSDIWDLALQNLISGIWPSAEFLKIKRNFRLDFVLTFAILLRWFFFFFFRTAKFFPFFFRQRFSPRLRLCGWFASQTVDSIIPDKPTRAMSRRMALPSDGRRAPLGDYPLGD